jgi:hypothetical protein
MNKERKKTALKKNIKLAEAAIEHANELLKNQDKSVVAFPAKTNDLIQEMKVKIAAYQRELNALEAG